LKKIEKVCYEFLLAKKFESLKEFDNENIFFKKYE